MYFFMSAALKWLYIILLSKKTKNLSIMIDFVENKIPQIHNKHSVNICFIDFKTFKNEIINIYNKQEILQAKYYNRQPKILHSLYIGILKDGGNIYFINDTTQIKNNDNIIVDVFLYKNEN